MINLTLDFNLSFTDLYSRQGLEKVDAAFVEELKASNADLFNRLVAARANPDSLDEKTESNLLIEVAPYLEDFIGRIFSISADLNKLKAEHDNLAPLYTCKRSFIQRRATKICKPEEGKNLDGDALVKELEKIFDEPFSDELVYAKHVVQWMDNPAEEAKTTVAAKYASWALNSEAGQKKHKAGLLFKTPNKVDHFNLIHTLETEIRDGITVMKLQPEHLRYREGFGLTDAGGDLKIALDDANYCIFCHNQGKDSCSKGLKEKPDPVTGEEKFKKTPLDIKQAGCPLEEKISEMNTLKSQGNPIGALAVVAVDNPLCAATGYRICNDCMKSCIYQKQDPVNIPRTETRVLQDILDLPWGFEIYGLLTRWNPLNLRRTLPREESGYKVLVVGLGPAGFNLSHHLINEGHAVIAVDGLKIEPLPEDVSGVKATGERVPFKPIRDFSEIADNLDERVLAGFGGVAEYGITVRWNKNYLKIVRLLLERRNSFAMYGGVRFGSTITYKQAFELGFDHVALCLGAGKPTMIEMPNGLARGVRTASDFLMSLQLTGAAKKNSIANLQVRLPVVVIGGGLTAIDTATESLAYYPIQVEKFLSRYEILLKEKGEKAVREKWSEEESIVADEFIVHAKAIRAEKERAKKAGETPKILKLINEWGGVKVAYRKRFTDSPSYRLNHEEVEKALEEGIEFVERVIPASVEIDKFGHAAALKVQRIMETGDGGQEAADIILPAKSIYLAAGTNPNTVLAREDSKNFKLDGKWFAAIDEDGNPVKPEPNVSKPKKVEVLMSKTDKGKFVSYFGDLHPSFVGNVVKAMGAAKQGYPIITKVLNKFSPASSDNTSKFIAGISEKLIARVHKVIRLTPNIIEVVVHAPLAAGNFLPGQFYRLQNFECFAPKIGSGKESTILAMEGLALTGAWVDAEKGLLSTIVLEMGGSSDLCAFLKEGEPVILMGPTGSPTEIPRNETVVLVGGGLGNAVLFSIGRALRQAGSKVLYFAGYKKKQDRYKVEEIEAAADVIVWACDEGSFTPERKQDFTFHGNIVQSMVAYGKGELGSIPIKMQDVTHLITIGSDRMMEAVAKARHTVLKEILNPKHEAVGSINSPMQCMMKEICAQCLQKHIDPVTGEEKYVYSCFNQDQKLDCVSFPHLNERLKRNGVQEKLTALWVDRSLKQLGFREKVA